MSELMIPMEMDDFAVAYVDVGSTRIFVRSRGNGPPILLLHGSSQTHVMWRKVAPLLARQFTVTMEGLLRCGAPGPTTFTVRRSMGVLLS
jgi:haloacetate dehalogenase